VQLAAALEDLVADQPQHPAIVAALAAGIEGTSAYFAQDYANGDALDASLRQHGPPPLESVIVTLSRLAEALDRAAGEGIHHGALHPRDLLISGGGEVRLIDLGVAQALQRAGLRASVRRPYSAPERMEGRTWGGPADIFALGAIVYEMVTGKRVAGPGPPAVSADGVSGLDTEALAEVLGRALHADPASRFASASDLEDELRPILARGRRAVLAPKRPRSRPEGVMPLPLNPEPPVLEAFDPEVTLTPTIAMSPVDLPLSHGAGEGAGDTERYRDVLAETVSHSFSAEEPAPAPKPVKGPVVVPPRAMPVPKASAAAVPVAAPEVVATPPPVSEPVAQIVEPPPMERGHEKEMVDRPLERASFSTWSTPPPAPDRRSLVIPLSFAMLLGLAGGFGLGYWTGWRSALREAPSASEASRPGEAAGRGPSPSAASAPSSARSAPSTSPAGAASASAPAGATADRTADKPASGASRSGDASGRAPSPGAAKPSASAAGRAPAARSAALGKLLVKSTPSGAQVRVDGRVRGKTPLILRDLPLKVVRVTVEHGGFHAEEQRVALTAARPTVTVDAKLTPLAPPAPVATTGSLLIESRPTGARVFLDGQDLGTTPVSVPEVAPGAHRVRIEMAGFSPWVTMAEIKAGVRSRVAASLEQGQAQ